ncbi:unnamed protein product [Oikopleura dioica]|uniref:Uncharacterized protein n=1 Tax=Oikopleura dioica TaxID=34765 RepID=E4XR55_OIKDI|nr:unnamed protein product [Oikopleura dioica]
MQAFRMTKPAKTKKTAPIQEDARHAGESGELVIVEEPTAETITITKAEWNKVTVDLEILEAKFKHIKAQTEQKDKKIEFNKEMNDERAKMFADTMLKQKMLEQDNVLSVSHP